jgi:hypothetical protein
VVRNFSSSPLFTKAKTKAVSGRQMVCLWQENHRYCSRTKYKTTRFPQAKVDALCSIPTVWVIKCFEDDWRYILRVRSTAPESGGSSAGLAGTLVWLNTIRPVRMTPAGRSRTAGGSAKD